MIQVKPSSFDIGRKVFLLSQCQTLTYAICKELDYNLQCILLWRDRLLEEKYNTVTICFHHFFGKVFERKADKCCRILKSNCCNSKAHRVYN